MEFIFIRVDLKCHRNFSDYFCCIHIFSAKLLICSQTLINLKHVQKLEILYEFDVRFHTNLLCFTSCAKHASAGALLHRQQTIYKQLLDEVFVISGIIKVEVSVISRSRRLRLITLTEILIIPDITKTESNNCFIIHCFEENNDKRIIAAITVYFQTLKNVQLSDKQIFTVFIKQSSAEKLNLYLRVISQ